MTSVFVSGTWRESKAQPYARQATQLGTALANHGFDLVCGPGTGITRPLIDGYRSVSQRGKIRFFLPRADLMAAVGEVVGEGADEIIQTEFDYPVRNVWQVGKCDGLFVLTGGDGTLEEALPALIDYNIPVSVVRGSGPAADALAALEPIFPEWTGLLTFGSDVAELVDNFIERVSRTDQR